MSDDKYTAEELDFVDKVMIAATAGLAGDSEYPLEKIPERARCLAVAALVERRKLRGPILVLDEEGAKRLVRLDSFYAAAYRLVGFMDSDPDAIHIRAVLMILEDTRETLRERSSELSSVSMANDALKQRTGELMAQVGPSVRAKLIRAATLIENLAEAVDDPAFASQSKAEAAQMREFITDQVKPQTVPESANTELVERCKLALFKAYCEPLGLPYRFDLLGTISANAFDAATRAVIAELALVPCDLPSVDKIMDALLTHAATMVDPAGARGVRLMLEACISPVLAAKDATIEQLQSTIRFCNKMSEGHGSQVGALNARIAELEKQLAEARRVPSVNT
jgi:hypothetical protein